MSEDCWCVCYESYIDELWYSIECVYFGNKAKEQAIKKAIDMNIEFIKEQYRDIFTDEGNDILTDNTYVILNDHKLSDEEKLEKCIDSLDISNGNYRYPGASFYKVVSVPIALS